MNFRPPVAGPEGLGVWQRARWPLALGAGLAQAVSLALPGSGQPVWWLQVLSLAVFARCLLAAPTARAAATMGWVFAAAWLVGTFWWLYISMHTYGGLAAPLAGAGVLALALFLALDYGLAAWAFHALAPGRRWARGLLFAALWTLAELARGTWWTGFPWGAGGYAHVEGPLAHLARYGGVYGVGAVAAWLAMGLAQARRQDVRRGAVWALGLALVGLWGGAAWQRHCAINSCHSALPDARPALPLVLLQGNIPQDEKFQPGSGVPMALQWYRERLLQPHQALVVAPETALPLLPAQLPPGYLDDLRAHYRQPGRAALLGVPLGSMEEGYTNSVLGLAPGQTTDYRYDKHHLVPFGEFIPPLFRWFTEMMNIPLGDFRRGALVQPPLAWHGERLAPNICYEDLFGEELAALFAQGPDTAPTVLVNLSNIGWFGNTLAIDQHLAISRMRALEFERPMVRATNTGATAVIDHRGAVVQQLARYERGMLMGQVQGRHGTPTPYAQWAGRWGLWPLWALGLALVAGLGLLGRRTQHMGVQEPWAGR